MTLLNTFMIVILFERIIAECYSSLVLYLTIIYLFSYELSSLAMSILLQDRVRKRRLEDDDDFMLFLFPAPYLTDSSGCGEKTKRHTSPETGEIKIRRLLEGHVRNCK